VLAERAVVGNGLEEDTQFGPIQNKLQYEKVKSYLDDARAHGRIIAGGEVCQRANDSEYGLGATIWSSNPERAFEVACRIESGTVWVNRHMDLPVDIPFAGAKQSGLGVEGGQEGLQELTQLRVINMAR
jgi:acyl-CoA reductase-like NAD-dependent aldehyde dehydrogenase